MSAEDIRPLLTTVVRLRSYGKADNPHVCKKKRPHLFFLTSDYIRIFTTGDAGVLDGAPTVQIKNPTSILGRKAHSAISSLYPFIPRKTPPQAAAPDQGNLESISSAAIAAEADPEDDLADGQAFRLGVSLNQVIEVTVAKENRIYIFFQPNKPSKKSISALLEEQSLTMLRGLKDAVDYYVTKADKTSSIQMIPNASIITIQANDNQEALEIKGAIDAARAALNKAVLWLSDGLPLKSTSDVVMVTTSTAASSTAYTIPFPDWNSEIQLPLDVSVALANTASRKSVNTVVTVYLSTPLGSATAEIPLSKIHQSAMEGSAPLTTMATVHSPCTPTESGTILYGRRMLQKKISPVLQWKAIHGDGVVLSRSGSSIVQDAAHGNGGVGGGRSGSSSISVGQTHSVSHDSKSSKMSGMFSLFLLVSAALLLIGTTMPQLLLVFTESPSKISSTTTTIYDHDHPLTITPTSIVDFLQGKSMTALLGLAALSALCAFLLDARRRFGEWSGHSNNTNGDTSISTLPGEASQHLYTWKLVLLDVDIIEETQANTPAAPPYSRTLTVSNNLLGSEGAVSDANTALPQPILRLMEQYPTLLTADVAQRFIIGLSSDTKAFAALSAMAKWTVENGLGDILTRPQPAYTIMKKHYPHMFAGWSKKKDCLVEIECMGCWPHAYTAIAADGVSEQSMLEHLLFIYQYAFNTIDPRPLPDGKTVKIVDLDGLTMSDLRTPGFKLITRVGAMLSLNFPQRLHQCFLINAPGWWALAWKLISPIIPPKVRAQMQLYSKSDKEKAATAMLEWVDSDILPVKYGGTNALQPSQYEYEIQMAKNVAELNEKK